jgi:hypothetical protein
MKKTKFSRHALEEREDRIVWIATEVGFGQVVDTIQIYNVDRGYRRVEFYETGVAVVKALDEELVITMYVPAQHQIIKWYGDKNLVPIRLLNVAKRNEKRGWTNNGL